MHALRSITRAAAAGATTAATVAALAALPAVAAAAPSRSAGAGTARPASHPSVLTVASVRVHAKAAPVAIELRRLPRDAKVRVWVNGRRAHDAVHMGAPGTAIGHLSLRHGLRRGRNTIRVRADRPDGYRDVERLTVRLPRATPIADAGRDVSTTSRTVTVGPAPPRANLKADAASASATTDATWTILDEPAGSDAQLDDPQATRPTLQDAELGTYVLRRTVTGDDADEDVSHDTVTVAVRPNDLPIGVSLHTFPDIAIDGRAIASGAGFRYVVLERATRRVVESGAVAESKAGAQQLLAIADRYKATDDDMMAVSHSGQRDPESVPVLDDLLQRIGGAPLSPEEKTALYGAQPFTFAGLPGAPRGAAWTKIRAVGGDREPDFNVLLQFNDATQKYDIVNFERPTYDTRVPDQPPRTNTMRFNRTPLTATYEADVTAALHVVAVNDKLAPIWSQMIPTNGTGGSDADRQRIAAGAVKDIVDIPGHPVILVQTVGKVKAAGASWNDLADQIERIGGNRWAFNELQGQDDAAYALVGRTDSDGPAVEASPALGDDAGRLVGALERSRRSYFEPQLAGTSGSVATQLTDLAYQRPEAFPAVNAAAMTYLAKRLNFCSADSTCDLRPLYWQRYRTDWVSKKGTLETATYPGGTPGFSQQEFDDTRAQLVKEVTALAGIRQYFETLKLPFTKAQRATQVDLADITSSVKNDLKVADGAITSAWTLTLISYSLKLGLVAGPPVSYGLEGMSAAFALGGFLSDESGKPTLADRLQTRADSLGRQLADSYDAAQSNLDTLALLFVSDWGKMRVAGEKVDNDWALGSQDGKALVALRQAARRRAGATLASAAYPALVRVQPPVGDAVGLECRVPGTGHVGPSYVHAFSGMSPNVQSYVADTIDAQGRWTRKAVFIAWNRAVWPSATVGDLLFKPVNARPTPGLGLSKLEVLKPGGAFERLREGRDRVKYCGLGLPFWTR